MASGDTIAAIATPPGRGGIGVIRISGPTVPDLLPALLSQVPPPRQAHFGPFLDANAQAIDHGLALHFPAPRSFTGEHVLELHAHGSPVVLDQLLRRILELGARLARPGEFSERAFLNDKIDLAQAEAIADLIDSTTESAARSAQRSLQGDFSRRIHALVEALIQLRLYVEASIDFTDEDIDFLSEGRIGEQLGALTQRLTAIRASARQGCLLRDGMTVVIAGRPNAGKSSLLNRLTGRDTAIVTAIAGTTRDTLREFIQLDGLPLHVIDTAGLRDDTDDPVEQEGMRRARAEIATADRILLLIDDHDPGDSETLLGSLPPELPVTRIHNKIDLSGHPPGLSDDNGKGPRIHLSLKTGAGVDSLIAHLKASVGYDSGAEGVFTARRRHLDALDRARQATDNALGRLRTGEPELLAEELRQAQHSLGEITGEFTSDDLLGRIFSSFCIGK
ncbi:MAG: tRNA uridine-5-carboxymethylaminomethyl(34) synthesis GTPase MnmE [Methylococcus sp.]|nr:MAG: tRNA uridine-5-carboxymethylaminomethyl(34) synthesis GTPase MnmE [Methylococcus sp.]